MNLNMNFSVYSRNRLTVLAYMKVSPQSKAYEKQCEPNLMSPAMYEEQSNLNSSHEFPDANQRHSVPEPRFQSLEQLEKWLDGQLVQLENQFKSFATAKSNRSYFHR